MPACELMSVSDLTFGQSLLLVKIHNPKQQNPVSNNVK